LPLSFGGNPDLPFNVSDNLWHHVAVVHNSTFVKVYLDGSLVYTSETFDQPCVIMNGSAPFMIGDTLQRSYGGTPSTGSVDAVGVWNRALNSAEVTALYNNGTGLELGTTPTLNTLTKIQGNAKFYGKVKFGV
jgi:hypothetical protein